MINKTTLKRMITRYERLADSSTSSIRRSFWLERATRTRVRLGRSLERLEVGQPIKTFKLVGMCRTKERIDYSSFKGPIQAVRPKMKRTSKSRQVRPKPTLLPRPISSASYEADSGYSHPNIWR